MITFDSPRCAGVLALILALTTAIPATQALDREGRFNDDPLRLGPNRFPIHPEVLQSNIGRRHEIPSVPLPGYGRPVALEMTEFRVFADDARILVHHADGDQFFPIPENRYFRGRVLGEPDSLAVMTVTNSGLVRGLITVSGHYWVMEGGGVTKALAGSVEVREVEAVAELDHDAQRFECGTDKLGIPPLPRFEKPTGTGSASFEKSASYTARIAVETDSEFFSLFGDAADATNYVADVIAFGSAIYAAEVNTSWILQHLSLWPTGSTDPWSQSSTDCALYEFGRYWNSHHTDVRRTTAAFFSGKSNGGGIAWLGVLCRGAFAVNIGTACSGLVPSIDNYGGAYAYIGDMDGNFSIENPSVVWDIVAATHEIGHNFNSPHTHCYGNLGGNSNPIDPCYGGECGGSGCYCGTTGLPAGCPGKGYGCGTIMSYCHLRSGGFSNLSLTLGQGHPYGVEPERVPQRMSSHVADRANWYPGCLDYMVPGYIFADGFSDGGTGAWSVSVP